MYGLFVDLSLQEVFKDAHFNTLDLQLVLQNFNSVTVGDQEGRELKAIQLVVLGRGRLGCGDVSELSTCELRIENNQISAIHF